MTNDKKEAKYLYLVSFFVFSNAIEKEMSPL